MTMKSSTCKPVYNVVLGFFLGNSGQLFIANPVFRYIEMRLAYELTFACCIIFIETNRPN